MGSLRQRLSVIFQKRVVPGRTLKVLADDTPSRAYLYAGWGNKCAAAINIAASWSVARGHSISRGVWAAIVLCWEQVWDGAGLQDGGIVLIHIAELQQGNFVRRCSAVIGAS